MKELIEMVADVIGEADGADGVSGLRVPEEDVAKEIVDVFRDAGWLPPDEVRNESADLQLAAMALVRALQGRLMTQACPPLGPLVDLLAAALGPYYRVIEAQHDPRTAEVSR